VPIQDYYSEALPTDAQPKRKVLSIYRQQSQHIKVWYGRIRHWLAQWS